MKTQPKYLKKKKRGHLLPFLGWTLLVLLVTDILILGGLAVARNQRLAKSMERPEPSVVPLWTEESSTPGLVRTSTFEPQSATEESSEPAERTDQLAFLPYLEEKRQDNPDVVGWITIPGTVINYPVMYTPEEPEKYLHLGFDGLYSFAGLPFIDAHCSILPESDNLLIYGHNMLDGSMFRSILKYEQVNFWQEHPEIQFDFKDEQRTYEVIAAFRDRVYYTSETCFKFYKFIDAESDEAYDEAIAYFKDHTVYDTGLTAKRGDHLITLVTCTSHTPNGRFVVVAREKQ